MDGTSLLPSLHPWGRCRSCTPAAGPNKSCCAHLSLFHHSTCFSAATINTSGGIKLVSAEKFFTSVTMTVIGTADISCTTTSGYPLKKTRQIIVNTMHHQIYYPLQQSLTVSPLEAMRVLPLLNFTSTLALSVTLLGDFLQQKHQKHSNCTHHMHTTNIVT